MNWKRLLPTHEVTKYPKDDDFKYPMAFGLDLTWDYCGLGLGIGLGRRDVWVGWRSTQHVSCKDHSGCEVKPS